MAIYKSEYELFLEEARRKHPEWAAQQREGLSLLWNKKVDLAEQKVLGGAAEKQHSYPYDVNF